MLYTLRLLCAYFHTLLIAQFKFGNFLFGPWSNCYRRLGRQRVQRSLSSNSFRRTELTVMNISLPNLYRRILSDISRVTNLPTMEDETQVKSACSEKDLILIISQILIEKCLSELKTLHSRLVELSLFSPNETLDDISTQDLLYLSVPYTFAEAQGRVRASNRAQRLNSLVQAEVRVYRLRLRVIHVIYYISLSRNTLRATSLW